MGVSLSGPFFVVVLGGTAVRRRRNMKRSKKAPKNAMIAYRKSCKADGTGLSHYILMDKKAK